MIWSGDLVGMARGHASAFGRLFDRLQRLRVVSICGLLGVAAFGGWLALSLELDMSFRPMFEDEPEALARNDAFEAVFGQISGSQIGAILVHDQVLSTEFLSDLRRLTDEVAELEHVVEVRSLTHLPVPIWDAQGLSALRIAGPEVADDDLVARVREFVQLSPQPARQVLSAQGDATLLWARLDLPLEDFTGRRPTVESFRRLVEERRPAQAVVHFVGASVVEDAYGGILIESLAVSLTLTTAVVLLLLFAVFSDIRSVIICMSGVTLSLPITLGAMQLLGQSITIVNSMVATLVLVIGVADAVHMLSAFLERRGEGLSVKDATRKMFTDTGLACLMTTATTAVGFLSLRFAGLAAIRDFGLIVALGIAFVYVANLIVIPNLLLLIPPSSRATPGLPARWVEVILRGVRSIVVHRPGLTASLVVGVFLVGLAAIPSLSARQKFNEEVRSGHPVRVAQATLEREFGGILGPEIEIRRRDGGSLLTDEALATISTLQARIANHPEVMSVQSYADLLPPGIPFAERAPYLTALRSDADFGIETRFFVDERARRAAVVVRIGDVGTDIALEFIDWLEQAPMQDLGDAYEAHVVGQWWLSQMGMSRLVTDLVKSFAAACIFVLPILALVLRSSRLFLIGLLPNVLPMLFALGFMAWMGLTLRIATAMILAIALGIAVDDTIHLLLRLKRESDDGFRPLEAVHRAIAHTGRAILLTSVILVAGFASMMTSEVLGLRDMGIVGSVALIAALVADVLLAPAFYLLSFPKAARTPGRSGRYARRPSLSR